MATAAKDIIGKANREVCNVVIADYATGKPYLDFKFANTTGINLTSESVYAMAHGAKKIAFNDPLDGQITITAQVLPFKLYALYSDGVIDKSGTYYKRVTAACTTAGKLTLKLGSSSEVMPVDGSVFVYNEGDFGGTPIEGSYASGEFTATSTENIAVGSKYEVGFLITRSEGVQKISLNNERIPRDIVIYMDTIYKDENGDLVPYHINVYKATIQRSLELSFNSTGDPQEVTLTFDCLEKDKDNYIDIIEITDEVELANA